VWGKEVSVSVLKPDGTKSTFIGGKEYVRKVDTETGEVVALLIKDAEPSDIPIDSVIELLNESNV